MRDRAVAVFQGRYGKRLRLDQCPLPEERGRNWLFRLPPFRHLDRGRLHGCRDPRWRRARQSSGPLDRTQSHFEDGMNQVAESQRLEDDRVRRGFRRLQVQRALPDEAEGVAQKHLQRTGRLNTFEDGKNGRIIRPHQAVVRSDLLAAPIAPAGRRGDSLRRRFEFVGARQHAVGFAECVRGDRVATQVGFLRLSLHQRASPEKAAFAVAAGPRKDDLRRGGREYR